jgi:hypothetical protein
VECVNCGGRVEPDNKNTYWEAKVAVRYRDDGGPNRRALKPTGRGYCPDCSRRLEHDLPLNSGDQEGLF